MQDLAIKCTSINYFINFLTIYIKSETLAFDIMQFLTRSKIASSKFLILILLHLRYIKDMYRRVHMGYVRQDKTPKYLELRI